MLRTVSSRLSILSLAALLAGCGSNSDGQMGAGGSGGQGAGTGGVSGVGGTNAGTGGVSAGTGGTIAGTAGSTSVQGGSGGTSQTGGSGGTSQTGGSGGIAGGTGDAGAGGRTGDAGAGGATGGAGGGGSGECKPPTSYANLFVTISGKTQAESDQKLATAWSTLFNPSGSGTIYFDGPGADESYVKDILNNDARSEGMSYGMMIAVQLDHQTEFDRIWSWVKNHMANGTGEIRWSCKTSGTG